MKSKHFEVIPILPFQRQAKKLVKKFPSLKRELPTLIQSLASQPQQGTALGGNCYKIRLSISSKRKGKSGGARVITCVFLAEEEVYLLSIYDKSERSSFTDKEVSELLDWIQKND